MDRIKNCTAEILVICVMPFLCGAATRLPFIYFVIHLDQHFELETLTIGLCVAMYQGSRVITSALATKLIRVSHFMGTAIGLAGFLTVYVSDNDSLIPFVAGTAVIGFSETMSSMQIYAKKMYEMEEDRKKADMKLKYQYVAVMLGVVFAFSVGGFLYQYFNINGVALFGVIIETLALAALILFFAVTPNNGEPSTSDESHENNDSETHRNHQEAEDNGPAEIDASTSNSQRSSRRSSISQLRLTALMTDVNSQYTTDGTIPITWVNWVMCVSFGIEALTIGYNLSIGPIFMLEEFKKQTGIIGIMFAVGAASGSVATTLVTCTVFGRKSLNKIASSPFDICFAMAGIGVGVLVAAVPSFPGHVCGVVLLMCFNDLGATLMTELQASITTTSNYSLIGPLGQVVRRSLNVITALTGPVFYGLYPRLPYFVAGGITLIWTVVLVKQKKMSNRSVKQQDVNPEL
ncbi:hypothetical protein ACHAXR_004633 [Thalassiosira sp. AJA248-18]